MVAKLGLLDSLVGRSFECDYPPEVTDVESIVEPIIDQTLEDHREIDQQIDRALEENGTIYRVDEKRLRSLEPDILITQDLCEVCAPSDRELSHVIEKMDSPPKIVTMSPHSISEIIDNMRQLAEVTDTIKQFQRWHSFVQEEFQQLEKLSGPGSVPGVVAVEWYDPLYLAGHWVPEQIRRAGGQPLLSKPEEPSHVVQPDDLLSADPDVLILMPCGMTADQALSGIEDFLSTECFQQISAIRNDRVYTVDASAYFARPGPRIVEGTKLIAQILWKDETPLTVRENAYKKVILSKTIAQ